MDKFCLHDMMNIIILWVFKIDFLILLDERSGHGLVGESDYKEGEGRS